VAREAAPLTAVGQSGARSRIAHEVTCQAKANAPDSGPSGAANADTSAEVPCKTAQMSADTDAIRNLLGRHAQLADDGDVDLRVDLYVPDGIFIMGERRSVGRDQLRAAFGATAATPRGGKHILSNTVIEHQGSGAKVQTDFAVFRNSPEGIVPFAIGRYYDTLVKLDDGWRFAERRLEILE